MNLPKTRGRFSLYAASGAAIPAEWAVCEAFDPIGLWIVGW
jgi:hypothetical protein